MNSYRIIIFSALGDILNSTPIASQLKRVDKSCHIEWVTSRDYDFLLQNNPYIDKLTVIDKSGEELAWKVKEYENPNVANICPAPYLYIDKYGYPPGKGLIDIIKLSCPVPIVGPWEPMVFPNNSDNQIAETFMGLLPKGPKIIIETEAKSGQSDWSKDHAVLAVTKLKGIEAVIIFTSKSPPNYLQDLQKIYPKTYWFNGPFLSNYKLLSSCQGFIGVSSGISCLRYAKGCIVNGPHIEVVKDLAWSAASQYDDVSAIIIPNYAELETGLDKMINQVKR